MKKYIYFRNKLLQTSFPSKTKTCNFQQEKGTSPSFSNFPTKKWTCNFPRANGPKFPNKTCFLGSLKQMGSSSLRKHAKFLENHVFSRNLNPFSLRSHVLGPHFLRKLGPIYIREIARPLLPKEELKKRIKP